MEEYELQKKLEGRPKKEKSISEKLPQNEGIITPTETAERLAKEHVLIGESSDQNDHMVLPLSSIDHQRRRLQLLGENRYPVSQVISGGDADHGYRSHEAGSQ